MIGDPLRARISEPRPTPEAGGAASPAELDGSSVRAGCQAHGCELPEWPTSTAGVPLTVHPGTIGFLGPWGTFTEEALRSSLGVEAGEERSRGLEMLPYPSVADTIDAVSTGEVPLGLVPIENSIEGSVSITVDVLAHEVDNLQIVREVRQPIRHRLISRPGVTFEEIEQVISHPHANAQCRQWLRKHLPGVPVSAANSTADAVQRVAESDEPWTAIGTALAAEKHGCVVLRENIEDHDDNETRFVFLSQKRERQDLREPYKTSVVCEIAKDQPGALLLILQEFAYRFINLTKIESRPSKRMLGDYVFLVDMEGRVDDPQINDALRCLTCKLPRLAVLGSYPVGRPF